MKLADKAHKSTNKHLKIVKNRDAKFLSLSLCDIIETMNTYI